MKLFHKKMCYNWLILTRLILTGSFYLGHITYAAPTDSPIPHKACSSGSVLPTDLLHVPQLLLLLHQREAKTLLEIEEEKSRVECYRRRSVIY